MNGITPFKVASYLGIISEQTLEYCDEFRSLKSIIQTEKVRANKATRSEARLLKEAQRNLLEKRNYYLRNPDQFQNAKAVPDLRRIQLSYLGSKGYLDYKYAECVELRDAQIALMQESLDKLLTLYTRIAFAGARILEHDVCVIGLYQARKNYDLQTPWHDKQFLTPANPLKTIDWIL